MVDTKWTDPRKLRLPEPVSGDGTFTDDERRRIRERVVTVGIHDRAVCPLCGHAQWSLAESPLAVPAKPTFEDRQQGTRRTYQCVGLICQNCGNLHLLNLITLELADIAEAVGRR